jgi:hypothetical protein
MYYPKTIILSGAVCTIILFDCNQALVFILPLPMLISEIFHASCFVVHKCPLAYFNNMDKVL